MDFIKYLLENKDFHWSLKRFVKNYPYVFIYYIAYKIFVFLDIVKWNNETESLMVLFTIVIMAGYVVYFIIAWILKYREHQKWQK